MSVSQFIPSKQRKTRIKKASELSPAPQVSKDLKDQLGAIEALSVISNLLQEGTFKVRYANAINISVQFAISMHDDMVEKALTHAEADLIPDLLKIKEERKKAAKDGKTKTQ